VNSCGAERKKKKKEKETPTAQFALKDALKNLSVPEEL